MKDLDLIKELESELEVEFKEADVSRILTIRLLKTCEYSLDEAGNVSGIYVSKINISKIPGLLTQFAHLTSLTIKDTEMEDVSLFRELRTIRNLLLFRNKITDIQDLSVLKDIHTLHLAYNQIHDIAVLKDFLQLRHLNLSYNLIQDISALKNLKNLEILDLKGNPVKSLPAWITDFDMDIKWKQSVGSGEISLFQNPIETPPVEIIKQGKEAVRNYFQQIVTAV